MSKNILLIGNGFNLAHRLPTTYMDFLFFCYTIKRLIIDNKLEENLPKNLEGYHERLENGEEVIFRHPIEEDCYIIDFCYGKASAERNRKIYYRNLEQKSQQIANFVKVIGPDELIKRTGGGRAHTITFKPQSKMIEIETSLNPEYER